MTFTDLREGLGPLKKKESRFDLADYVEFVIEAGQIEWLRAVLEQFFGQAVKAVGEEPSEELTMSMEKFGGIRPDQILYLAQQNGTLCYAMIWPWGDRASATVRIAKIPNPFHASTFSG